MKKTMTIIASILGVASFSFVGLMAFVVFGLYVSDTSEETNAYANELNRVYDVEDEISPVEEVIDDPYAPVKGEYGHQTVTMQTGDSIDSVEVIKSEYANVEEFLNEMNNIYNGNAEDKVKWNSEYEKGKYFAESIVVYINHFGQVSNLKGLQAAARNVLETSSASEAKESIEILKAKVAEVRYF